MEDMKADMTGAAIVLATMQAVARLGLPVNLVGYLALTENMLGGRAMKLGDVLTMRNGKTVEVLNTDAEGRLILADALSFAVEGKPDRVLDLATLTGACMVALGTKIAGLFSNDEPFAQAVQAACRAVGRTRLAAPARRRLPGGAQEPRRRPEERRRQVGRRHHGRQVPPAVRRRDPLGPPRHRRPELGRLRRRHPRRRRHRLLRAHARRPGRSRGAMRNVPEDSRVENRRRRSAGAGGDQDWQRRSSRRHSIRRLLMSSFSRISRTSSMGWSVSMAQFKTSRFSWPHFKRSRISSMRSESWKARWRRP